MAGALNGTMAAARSTAATAVRILLRPLGLALLVAALFLLEEASAGRDPPPFSMLAVVFRGSGCRAPDDIRVRTQFDASGGLIRVGFPTAFAATSGPNGKTVRVACNGVIPFSIDEGKRIGITQVRVAGRATIGSETSTALLTTEFFFPGERGPAMHERFLRTEGSQDFEYIEPTGTVWSKCGGKQSFRVNAALLASGVDAEIAMEEGNGNGEGFQYEVIVRDCVANARQEL